MSLNDVYRDRYYEAGNVYIAGSLLGRVIKIGTAKNMGGYPRYLQSRKYGSLGDWEILYCCWVNEGAGRIEHDARGRLQQHKTMRMYEKDGRPQKGREILKCSFSAAFEALNARSATIRGQTSGDQTTVATTNSGGIAPPRSSRPIQ
jgi:hypothetical protein